MFNETPADTDLVYSHTGYDVTSCFRLDVLAEKLMKKQLPTVSGRISQEWFKRGSRNFTTLSGTVSLIKMSKTSITASSRLQNVTDYCLKVRKTDPAAKESNNLTTG